MDNSETHDIAIHRHGGAPQSNTKDREIVNKIKAKSPYGPSQILAKKRENTAGGLITTGSLRKVCLQRGKKG
ncbi:MAG: hypothetical protein GTO13_09830 [Proteobacteria bacterium]|nr:hypothetical protein [Pseudomonadota bacterium]